MNYKIVTTVLFMMLSGEVRANWDIKIDEDSQGPRCVVYSETLGSKSVPLFENKRFVFFTIVSSKPLSTEYSFKFAYSGSGPVNPIIKIGNQYFNILSRNSFGWLEDKKAEKQLFESFLKNEFMSVIYTLNGRLMEERISSSGLKDSISEVIRKCHLKV
ncbi:hypothetical protein KIH24_01125 [Rhizobiales bacterium TNE-4]|nr:hypothetical protein [Rhizobiales bacterium TNE-4]MBV1826218.1 hypothetical protein [Rhizobiales bacterium TNE-4]